MKLALAATVLAVALLAPSALAGGAKLNGTVGPGFTITLAQGGKKVTTLKAGSYTIVVADKASIHDFHLTGPGVNKATGVGFVGTQTWKVTLKKGKYTYRCDPHHSFMKGSFTVT